MPFDPTRDYRAMLLALLERKAKPAPGHQFQVDSGVPSGPAMVLPKLATPAADQPNPYAELPDRLRMQNEGYTSPQTDVLMQKLMTEPQFDERGNVVNRPAENPVVAELRRRAQERSSASGGFAPAEQSHQDKVMEHQRQLQDLINRAKALREPVPGEQTSRVPGDRYNPDVTDYLYRHRTERK